MLKAFSILFSHSLTHSRPGDTKATAMEKESRSLRDLPHPNIIRLYGTKAHPEKLLVMELCVPGLDRLIDGRGRALEEWETIWLLKPILEATAYMNSKKYIHRLA